MQLKIIQDWLNNLLLKDFVGTDVALNGLQVGDITADIHHVACAVDASLQSLQQMQHIQAQLLFVHHGFFWGRVLSVTGTHYERIRWMMDHHLHLYASHLPLDIHPEVGNNVQLAQHLGLQNLKPFGVYKASPIGVVGCLPEPMSIQNVCHALRFGDRLSALLDFGPSAVRSVAVVTGNAPHLVEQAIQEGCDLFLTGEPSHEIYHLCREAKIHVICGGHYNTETFGPQAVGCKIQEDLGLKVSFIDCPTGL